MTNVVHLGHVADVVSGVGFPKEMQGRAEGEVPVFKVGDISNALKSGTRHLRRSPNHLSKEAAKHLSKNLMPAGTTVFAKIGEGLKLNRRGILAQPSLVDNNVMGLIPRTGVVAPDYLYYFMQTVDLGELSQATAIPSVRKSDVVEIRIPLCALAEQETIVAEIEKQFSRLDEAVAGLQRVKANLKRYKAAVLKSAVTGRLVPTEADLARSSVRSHAFEPSSSKLPEGWQLRPLSDVTQVQLGQQRAPVHAAAEKQIPYIRAANVTWDGLDLSDVKSMGFPNEERYRLQIGDVLLAEASGSANEVGKPAIWNGELSGACYQKTLIRIRTVSPEVLMPRFIHMFFLHVSLSGQFAKLAPGVGILHLTAERMFAWPMLVPPLPEQHRIVAEVDRLLSIAREAEAEVDANLKRAQGLRQAILARSFQTPAS